MITSDKQIKKNIRSFSNKKLVEMVYFEKESYTDRAVAFAEEELEKRFPGPDGKVKKDQAVIFAKEELEADKISAQRKLSEEKRKLSEEICSHCKKKTSKWNKKEIDGNQYCMECANDIIKEKLLSNIIITTTNHIDGHKVSKYIGIESVEIVLGTTGVISEITSIVGYIFGMRFSGFEKKLQDAKQLAFDKLKMKASEIGGNAIIGIDVDYTEFMDNRIGLIVNGTVVIIEQIARIEEKLENI